jgi:dihydrofolate reductase
MPKVIVAQFVSLDGVTEDPEGSGGTPFGGWAWSYGPEPVAGDKFRMGPILDTGVLLTGRVTWEIFAGLFPGRDDGFARRLNSMDKLVATRSEIDTNRWENTSVVKGDLADAVTERAHHQDVYVPGSGSVVAELIARDLVDEYRLLVFPIVLGQGHRLFDGAPSVRRLRLVSSVEIAHGAQLQIYRREGEQ